MPTDADVAVNTKLTLYINNFQNPVLYIVFKIRIYSYWVDSDGESYLIDYLDGFEVDLSKA